MFRLIWQFTPVLAPCDPFGVDVPLNFDITHSLNETFFVFPLTGPTKGTYRHYEISHFKLSKKIEIFVNM